MAQYWTGLRILDVSVPADPVALGIVDTAGSNPTTQTAVARDSFGYLGWVWPQRVKTVDVSNPRNPILAGGCTIFNPPQDMVLRDSFLYIAELARLQILGVARPRQPVLVGNCELPFDSWKLLIQDSLAYVANVTSLKVVNAARPDSPVVIGTWSGRTLGIDISDTILLTASSYYGCVALSIANPRAPHVLDSLPIDDHLNDVVVTDTLAYVGGSLLHVINRVDPRNLREVGTWTPPYTIRRLLYEPPYIYAACYDGGICILETLETGIGEQPQRQRLRMSVKVEPSVTTGLVTLRVPEHGGGIGLLEVYDVIGSRMTSIKQPELESAGGSSKYRLDLRGLPAGVYSVRVNIGGTSYTAKVVKTRRR